MKETPTEERDQGAAINPSDAAERNDPLSPSTPEPTGPLALPTVAPAPKRWRLGQGRGPLSLSKKNLLILVPLTIVVLIAVTFGAYAALNNQHPQHPQAVGVPTATSVPTESPARREAEREAQFINQMISQMTLQEELGQMIMVEWDEGGVFNADLQYMLDNQHAGGIILYTFNHNIETRSQVMALTAAIQSHAQIPLLISTDQEGGLVNRLDPITGPRDTAKQISATGDPNNAYKEGVYDGQIMQQLGFNNDLAPDVDVQSLSDATFEASEMAGFETRMYGSDPQTVAMYAGEFLNGLQEQGVIGTLKHWPGLGDDTVDPHDTLPVLNRSQADLNRIDFAPYRTLLAEGNVDMIMSTHELVPAYDPNLPATLSPILIDQVLRHDLGYQGVVITDGLYMAAIRQHWMLAQAAVLAVIAGNDMLLGPYNIQGMQSVLDALQTAVTSGQITKARIDQSVARILALKIKYGMIKMPPQG